MLPFYDEFNDATLTSTKGN